MMMAGWGVLMWKYAAMEPTNTAESYAGYWHMRFRKLEKMVAALLFLSPSSLPSISCPPSHSIISLGRATGKQLLERKGKEGLRGRGIPLTGDVMTR